MLNKKTALELIKEGASSILSKKLAFQKRAINSSRGDVMYISPLEELNEKYTYVYFDVSALGGHSQNVNCLIDILLVRQMLSNQQLGDYKKAPFKIHEDMYAHILNTVLYERSYRNDTKSDNKNYPMSIDTLHLAVECRIKKFLNVEDISSIDKMLCEDYK